MKLQCYSAVRAQQANAREGRMVVAVRQASGGAEACGGWRRTGRVLRWAQRRVTVVGVTYRRRWSVAATAGDGVDAGGNGGARVE